MGHLMRPRRLKGRDGESDPAAPARWMPLREFLRVSGPPRFTQGKPSRRGMSCPLPGSGPPRCTVLRVVTPYAERERRGPQEVTSCGGRPTGASSPGPAANLRYNLNEVIASLGCTVDLQVNNTRAAWRVSTAPLRAVFKDLLVRAPRTRAGSGLLSPGGQRDWSWEI